MATKGHRRAYKGLSCEKTLRVTRTLHNRESRIHTRMCAQGHNTKTPSCKQQEPRAKHLVCQVGSLKRTRRLWNFYILICEFTYSVRRWFSSCLREYVLESRSRARTPKAQWRLERTVACTAARYTIRRRNKEYNQSVLAPIFACPLSREDMSPLLCMDCYIFMNDKRNDDDKERPSNGRDFVSPFNAKRRR